MWSAQRVPHEILTTSRPLQTRTHPIDAYRYITQHPTSLEVYYRAPDKLRARPSPKSSMHGYTQRRAPAQSDWAMPTTKTPTTKVTPIFIATPFPTLIAPPALVGAGVSSIEAVEFMVDSVSRSEEDRAGVAEPDRSDVRPATGPSVSVMVMAAGEGVPALMITVAESVVQDIGLISREGQNMEGAGGDIDGQVRAHRRARWGVSTFFTMSNIVETVAGHCEHNIYATRPGKCQNTTSYFMNAAHLTPGGANCQRNISQRQLRCA